MPSIQKVAQIYKASSPYNKDASYLINKYDNGSSSGRSPNENKDSSAAFKALLKQQMARK